MSRHVYIQNQVVSLRRGVHSVRWPDARYIIVRCLPESDVGQPQYLLSNLKDRHRRVVVQSQIEGLVDDHSVVPPSVAEDVPWGRA